LRKHISFVDQNVVLFNDTVANNIAYGANKSANLEQVKQAAVQANALDFIEELPNGFDTVIGEDGTRLSGGQRQRIAIARAILKDAPLLILDEATSALDSESEKIIQAALQNVMKGRTTLVIAHRLSTIENADKVVVMSKGGVAEIGTHKNLLQHDGIYAKLHRLQGSVH
nr:ATP-binding cassette domain-containing protein [Gammaproteobacteria bacterium]